MRMILLTAILLAGCADDSPNAAQFTLYRNSPIDRSLRVEWASFGAEESDSTYNRNNCEMAARLLNANVAESARAAGEEPHEGVGFWCESGSYSEGGSVPSTFAAAFPTDVPEAKQVP